MKKLLIYLHEYKIKRKDLAEKLGVKRETITNWIVHNRKPHIATARKLVEATNGVITLKDCGH